MGRALLATIMAAFLLSTSGCKSTADNKEAIRAGIIKHIAGMSGLNVNNMTITVTQATIDGDKAQANVDIRAKNGDPNVPAMQLSYELQKQDNEWVVLRGQPTGGMQHPGPGEMPPLGSLPPGHPSMGGTSGQAPANHPDFNAILNSAQPPAQKPQQENTQPPSSQPSSSQP
jgi:hypothetical protein